MLDCEESRRARNQVKDALLLRVVYNSHNCRRETRIKNTTHFKEMLSTGVFSLISLTSYWVDVHLHRILVYVRTKSNPGDLTPSLVSLTVV